MVAAVLEAGQKMCSRPSAAPDFSSFLLLVVRQLSSVYSQAFPEISYNILWPSRFLAACTMMKFHCLLWPMKCLACVCCAQSWLLYSLSSPNHMGISHLAFAVMVSTVWRYYSNMVTSQTMADFSRRPESISQR